MAASAPIASIDSLSSSPKSNSSKRFRGRTRSRSKSVSRDDQAGMGTGAVLLFSSISDGEHVALEEMLRQRYGPQIKAVHLDGAHDFGFVEFATVEQTIRAESALRSQLEPMTLQRCVHATPGHDPRLGVPSDTLVLKGVPFHLTEAEVNVRLAQAEVEVAQVNLKLNDKNDFTGMVFLQFPSVAAAEAAASILRTRNVFQRRITIEFKRLGHDVARRLRAFRDGPESILVFPEGMSVQERQIASALACEFGLTPDPESHAFKVWKAASYSALKASAAGSQRLVRGFHPSAGPRVHINTVPMELLEEGKARSSSFSGFSALRRPDKLRLPRGPDGTRGFVTPRKVLA